MCSDGKGSPPQVRGKHRHSLPRKAEHKDHPRRCGENRFSNSITLRVPGSPPQVRGKLYRPAQPVCGAGITPAGAGKTEQTLYKINHAGDHPRRCGENPAGLVSGAAAWGSPPQVRGKRIAPPLARDDARITPAGAGKTIRAYSVCVIGAGSPPQVRGKRTVSVSSNPTAGITPAGAGKTWSASVVSIVSRDHPRRCGENANVAESIRQYGGSPPQVRGKLAVCRGDSVFDRITPAGAGKTRAKVGEIERGKDHPRRCGENMFQKLKLAAQTGSPPQVRGKQRYFKHVPRKIRITPAGAGKTAHRFE